MRSALLLAAVAALALSATTASAAEVCRDKGGRFIKCVHVAPAPAVVKVKPARCRDVHGRFSACKPATVVVKH